MEHVFDSVIKIKKVILAVRVNVNFRMRRIFKVIVLLVSPCGTYNENNRGYTKSEEA